MTAGRVAEILARLAADGLVFVMAYDGSAPDDVPEGAMLITLQEERELVRQGAAFWSLPCSCRLRPPQPAPPFPEPAPRPALATAVPHGATTAKPPIRAPKPKPAATPAASSNTLFNLMETAS